MTKVKGKSDESVALVPQAGESSETVTEVKVEEGDKTEGKPKVEALKGLIIPFQLDATAPSIPISTAYEWWLRKGAQMFPHLVATIPITSAASTSTTTGMAAASTAHETVTPVPEDTSSSAPSVIA